jgi:DNA-binding IclR family transcriptional regulator
MQRTFTTTIMLRTPSAPALVRGLTILELLAHSAKGLTLSDFVRKMTLPKSSVHCLLLTLERRGYLHRDDRSGRYHFGLKLFGLANLLPTGIKLREQAAPFLKGLMSKTRLTVHLGVLDQNGAILVEKVELPGSLRLATWLRKTMDLHCTGVGKALMAHLREEEMDRLIKEHGLPRHNENTVASPRKLKGDLAEVRRRGYAVDDEEDEIGLRCVGAPVFDFQGACIAAISVAGPITQIRAEDIAELGEQVKQTADAISRQLGLVQESAGGRVRRRESKPISAAAAETAGRVLL